MIDRNFSAALGFEQKIIPGESMEHNTENSIVDKTIEMTMILPHDSDQLSDPGDVTAADTATQPIRTQTFFRLDNLLFRSSRPVADDTMDLGGYFPDETNSSAKIRKAEDTNLQDVFQRYNISSRPFASGGQGSVSTAFDLALGCRIAVKSLHKKLSDDPQARNAFFTEAQLTASLDHPGIIPVHGLFSDQENGMHLAMKMIEGCTLRKYLDCIIKMYEDNGFYRYDERKSLYSRLEIFLRVCDAAGYAHDRGILHRDLKLENIMVGKYRETYVTDWGIAMRCEDAESLDKVCGTPAFVAPEVVTEKRSDVCSDVYSLGVILFELVTLTPAFPGKDPAAVIQLVKYGKHAPLQHRFGRRIDSDLAAVIKKAIATDPQKRYPTVGALANDLRRFLAHEEVTANPDNLFSKICRWGINHHKGMLTATLTALLLSFGSIAYSLNREIRGNAEKRIRDLAVSSAYSDVLRTANDIERSIVEIEDILERLCLNMKLSIFKVDHPDLSGKSVFVPIGALKNKTSHNTNISDGVVFFNYLNKAVSHGQLRNFENSARYMRSALSGLRKRALSGREDLAADKKHSGPAKMIYFAMTDGLFAAFPGTGDFPSDYDPEKRSWYRRALQSAGKTVWSLPYRDISSNRELITTCSLTVSGADGKFAGVGAVDFSLQRLANRVLRSVSKRYPFVHEKMLVNADGRIVFRMAPEGERSVKFYDRELIRRMLIRKYGTLPVVIDGNEKLLVFSFIKSLDILYVEYLDMNGLVENRRAMSI